MKRFIVSCLNNMSHSSFSIKKRSIVAFAFTFLVVLIGALNQRQHMADVVSIVFIFWAALYWVVHWRPQFFAPFMIQCYCCLLIIALIGSVGFVVRDANYSNIKPIASLYPFILVLLYYHFFETRRLLPHHLVPVALFIVFFGSIMVYQNSLNFGDITSRQGRTNWANLVGACLPMLFLIRGRIRKLVVVITVNFVLAVALKRSGILVGFFSVLVIMVLERGSLSTFQKYLYGFGKVGG